MTNNDLSQFYGISSQAVGRWPAVKRHRKTVQALAGAEQPICDLLADIVKLSYIFDCSQMHGVFQRKWCSVTRTTTVLNVYIFAENGVVEQHLTAHIDSFDAEKQLYEIKSKLEELVYGL